MMTLPKQSMMIIDVSQDWGRLLLTTADFTPCLTGSSLIVKVERGNGDPSFRVLLGVDNLMLQGISPS